MGAAYEGPKLRAAFLARWGSERFIARRIEGVWVILDTTTTKTLARCEDFEGARMIVAALNYAI